MSPDPRAVVRAKGLVSARVARMVEILQQRSDGLLERLRLNALEELGQWDDLAIVPLGAMPPTDCSIAGVYLGSETPPRIGIWEQVSRARAVFTVLHELGHHLQQTDDGLIDELDGEPDHGSHLEERTSDSFAAHILLPSKMVFRHLGAGTPTAQGIVELWRDSGVSRAAACVVAAQQLTSPGHIVLLDGGTVAFSSSHAELPLRRHSDQSASEIVRTYERSSLSVVTTEESRFTYRDGILGTPLYAQATDIGGYTLVVAVAHNAPWMEMSLPAKSRPVEGRWQTCGRCDHIFQVWGSRCEKCSSGFCPECGKCDCESRVAERRCEECFLMKPAQVFAHGSDRCTECAE